MAKEKPIYDIKIGAFQGSIFLNEVEKDGQIIKVPSANLQKSWTKDGRKWEDARISFFNALEIDKAIEVLKATKMALYTKIGQDNGTNSE